MIAPSLGDIYQAALKTINSDSKGAADICAYFFRKAFSLLRDGGASGLIATNTIAQADTREVGLDWIAGNDGFIFRAISNLQWPGEAAVNVSVVHISRALRRTAYLNGKETKKFINTQLLEGDSPIAPAPKRLALTYPRASGGTGVLGIGFVISPELYGEWLREDEKYAEIIQPYANGSDVVSLIDDSPTSYVINFGERTEKEASEYPLAFARVREMVKPIRDRITRQIHEVCYWKHWDKRPSLYKELKGLHRVLVCPFVSKHLPFKFLPSTWIYSKEVVVIPTDRSSDFAILQSSAHAIWARRYSGTLELRLSYSISDALRTFPVASKAGKELSSVADAYLS
ncbi:MAG: hypothetical protein KDD53_11910, partial [Bdellovibrionales bacterium]|nr:hypothetical protein [Bdellovibrionales bacterium]